MKSFSTILFAFFMTAVIGGSMFLIGNNALSNHNNTPIVNTSGSAPLPASPAAPLYAADPQQQQVAQQLFQQEQLVNAYQVREIQYKMELQQAADRLNQANQSRQTYQQLVQNLQQAGMVSITSDGRILIQ